MSAASTCWEGAADAARFLAFMHDPGDVIELRAPKIPPRRTTFAGYYDDTSALIRDAMSQEKRGAPGVYVTMNRINSALLARSRNRGQDRPEATTGNSDVTRRRWLFLDVDPVRPSAISATEEEHQAALRKAEEIAAGLSADGWPAPMIADSGNGAYLFYRIDLPADDDGLVGRVLAALGKRFDDARVKVDPTAANAARIVKLVGTLAQKGDALPDRPHRRSRIVSVPYEAATVTRELLDALAGPAPKRVKATEAPRTQDAPLERLDLEAMLRTSGFEFYREGAACGDGRKWVFSVCPFNDQHTDNSAWVAQFASGAIDAGCQHSSCSGKGWHDLRAILQPGWKPWSPASGQRRTAREDNPAPAPTQPVREATRYRDLEAEKALLGVLVRDPVRLADVSAVLTPDAFAPSNAAIYQTITSLVASGVPVEAVTIRDALDRAGSLGKVVGEEALNDLWTLAPSGGSLGYYANIVADKAAARTARAAAQRIIREIDEAPPMTVAAVRELCSRELEKSVSSREDSGARWVYDCVVDERRRVDDDAPDTVFATGVDFFDCLVNGGVRPGQLVIIAARPGVGKTSFGLQLLAGASHEHSHGGLFVSLEMGRDEVTRIMLAQKAKLCAAVIRRKRLHPTVRANFDSACDSFQRSRLFVDDRARTIVDITTRTRQLHARFGLGVLCVDYVQLVDCGRDRREENRNEAIGRLSRSMKLLARDLGIAVIGLAQFNRAIESREGHKPRLSDLRESGSLEQDADIVIAIHRATSKGLEGDKSDPSQAEMIVLKHRGGATNAIPLRFDGPTQTFSGGVSGGAA